MRGGQKRENEPPLHLITKSFTMPRTHPSIHTHTAKSSHRMPLHMPGEVIRPPGIITVRAFRTLRLGLGLGRKVGMLSPEMPRERAVVQVRLVADRAAEGTSTAAAGIAFTWGSWASPTLAPTRWV